jgi:hypothetical protein
LLWTVVTSYAAVFKLWGWSQMIFWVM